MLTIFIPSYNRRDKLSRAIESVFSELELSKNGASVRVLVVDDYSNENIELIIQNHRKLGRKIDFRLQPIKCGVAEIAMFSCLQFVDTTYAWILGNDDRLIPGSIDYLYDLIAASRADYYLLNFTGVKDSGEEYFCYSGDFYFIRFDKGVQLFKNFGFATATTTFPCLCFNVDVMRSVDYSSFLDISPIYGHTFSMFIAFLDRPSLFVPKPLVYFNHNDAIDEHRKLDQKNYSFGRTSYYHVSMGYIRHLLNVSSVSGLSLCEVACFREDEIDKNTNIVTPTLSVFFALNGCITQLIFELESMVSQMSGVIYSSYDDIVAQQKFFDAVGIDEAANYFRYARSIYASTRIAWPDKISELRHLQIIVSSIGNDYVSQVFDGCDADVQITLPFGRVKNVIFDPKLSACSNGVTDRQYGAKP